jgi:hypothetical protein
MAGTISLSLSQQFDELGEPLAGGRLYIFAAGTTTPQNAYSDTALTIPLPNPIILDAAGRIPQFFLADGQIKIRLASAHGITQINADNVLVIGPSSGGGGGGGSIDATTVLTTGDVKTRYGTGALPGFVRLNARTIGSSTSGATERANADTQALFEYLWQTDSTLAVSTGRGVSSAADWSANKTIALPDARGRVLASLDDMGNTAAGRLTSTYFGATPTVLGAARNGQSQSLILANTPPIPVSGAVAINDPGHPHNGTISESGLTLGVTSIAGPGGGLGVVKNNAGAAFNIPAATTGITASFSVTAGGSSAPFSILPPMLLVTNYIKL